jgi:hypothetical protein
MEKKYFRVIVCGSRRKNIALTHTPTRDVLCRCVGGEISMVEFERIFGDFLGIFLMGFTLFGGKLEKLKNNKN